MARKNKKSEKEKNNLKFVVPAVLGAATGIAWLAKKIPVPGIDKESGVKGFIGAYKDSIINHFKPGEIVEVSAEPAEYDPEEVREYIAENLCLTEITEQDWMMGGVKLLFTAIETNYNDMLFKNGREVENPVWHGYVAGTEGTGKYILKAAKESAEDIYMFWEEKTGFIFALHEGLDYLMQLKCGMSADEFEAQGPKFMNHMGLLEVLIEKFDIELNEDTDLEDVLVEKVLETYFEEK